MPHRSKATGLGVAISALAALSAVGSIAAPVATAAPVPSPGNPGPLFSPALSKSTFGDPGAALRPKFRWWQPVADTTDSEIQKEVNNMAADGGGGFEQNGFPATMNGGGFTPQFTNFANSQEFNSLLGWGTAAWSDRVQTYQSQAVKDNVIGDMNEGSRWNNSVPAVFSQNQRAAAQQLVFGDAQLKPGTKPSTQLPPVISNTVTATRTNRPGNTVVGTPSAVSTTLCQAAQPGDTNLQVDSIAGLLTGDTVTLGQGDGAESATIKKVGTASPCVPISQPAKAGDTVVHVPMAPSETGRNSSSTTVNQSAINGVPGTGMLPAQYTKGESVTIGSGAGAQKDTIASVGTYDVAAPASLAAPASAGDSNVLLTSTAGFLKGDTITVDAGQPDQQTSTITAVGEGGTGTQLSQAAASGDNAITVASTTGLAAGNQIVIDAGKPDRQTVTIASVSTTATSNNVTLQGASVAGAFPAGTTVQLADLGVSFSPALSSAAASGATVTDTGTGITLDKPVSVDHPLGDEFMADGSGLTLTKPLTKAHATGGNTAPQTTLAAQANAGDTTIQVASANGLHAGDTIAIDRGSVVIASIGTPGSSSTPVTLNRALSAMHFAGAPVIDSGQRTTGTTTLASQAWPGQTTIKVASVDGLSAGDKIAIGAPGEVDEIGTIAANGVGTAGASGTGLTLSGALSYVHASGSQVTNNPAADDSAGVSDAATKKVIAVEFAQCTASDATSCPAAATTGTRSLDPDSVQVVTAQVKNGALQYNGTLPQGNGNPWEEIAIYQTADGQTLGGATATSPDYWLDHLSATGAQAMADYFDNHILNNTTTQDAIRYQDSHSGTPAVFEDSLEDSSNLKWTNGMLADWTRQLGYNPVKLLPAILGESKATINTPVFDFTQNDSHGASLGWRVREDYRQMWNNLYVGDYMPTLDKWADSHGLVARFQSYGDPIDEGQASATSGIPEGEHLEFGSNDETQQFKVVASGTYQDGNKVVSDECCEESGDAWADTFGVDGTGTGPEGSPILSNANSVYADDAGGSSQIVYHGWPYTIGAAGRSAVWPGNTYGGDTSFSAGNGPNQPQFADDAQDNGDVARLALALRQGLPGFDVAVYHQDLGLNGQGADDVTNGEVLGNRVDNGQTFTPTTGKLIKSSSSLAQDGYTYGYVSPAFFGYNTAKFATDAAMPEQNAKGAAEKVLFPGHGDYRSLVIYDQSVMPVNAAKKILSLAQQGLPVVIIGQVPDATASAYPGTITGITKQDQQVQNTMTALLRLKNVKVVNDSTAAGSTSSDGNAPEALQRLKIAPTTALSPETISGTAQPVDTVRRYDKASGTNYYYLFNPNLSATVAPKVTLTGFGAPYLLDTWNGTATPIAGYKTTNTDRIKLSARIAPGNFALIAISQKPPAGATASPTLHATATKANATPAWSANVKFDANGQLVARADQSGKYKTTLSNGKKVTDQIKVPKIAGSSGTQTLTNWQLSVDSWGPTPSGDPTQTSHTQIPASGMLTVQPLSGSSNGALPSWTQINPQNGFPVADNLTNVAGIGTYTTSFKLPAGWSESADGAYLNLGVAVDTVDISVNGKAVTGLDQNDRNEIDLGPYLQAGTNTMTVKVATPLRNAVAVAPSTPATGQVPNSADPIGQLQGGAQVTNMGLIGPVTLTPYGQATVR